MKQLILPFVLCNALTLSAQTAITNASYSFAGGVYPTYSVVFHGTTGSDVEKWFKDRLKPISADMGGKKEVMSIGTRIPEVSADTMRVFVKADQPKKSQDVTVHVAFRLNNAFIGPDSEERQHEGCRNWMYQGAVALKKEIAQAELDGARKDLAHLEDDMALLVKEKERAEGAIEKTRNNLTDDKKDKAGAESDLEGKKDEITSKRAEIATSANEENTKDLQSLIKDQEKLERKVQKLEKSIDQDKKKIEDLQFDIKKNLKDQEVKGKAIESQKVVVEELTRKLAGIN